MDCPKEGIGKREAQRPEYAIRPFLFVQIGKNHTVTAKIGRLSILLGRSFFVFIEKSQKGRNTMKENQLSGESFLEDFLDDVEEQGIAGLFDTSPSEETAPKQPNPPVQTVLAEETKPDSQPEEDPYAAALKRAEEDRLQRRLEKTTQKDAVFSYGKARDPITDKDVTFEGLRLLYQVDFPELSEGKNVSWSVSYGTMTKMVQNPGSDRVYDVKAEMERSRQFQEMIQKRKGEQGLECLVKPHITAQKKGSIPPRIPQYKAYCTSQQEAEDCPKPIVVFPSGDGKLYQIRKTFVGTFTAPAEFLPEFPTAKSGFRLELPKIPMELLYSIISFFRHVSQRHHAEALVKIFFDREKRRYVLHAPKQKVDAMGVETVEKKPHPPHLVPVMDIHSHHNMEAKFSPVDDADEKRDLLYGVVGRLDHVFPEISVRACCSGTFIPLEPQEIFETTPGHLYPKAWEENVTVRAFLKKKKMGGTQDEAVKDCAG